MRLPMNTSLATLKPSGIRRINALAAQHPGCIALALGEPDFPTPDVISAEVTAALDRGDTHYPPNNGRPALREALSAYMGDAGLTFSADEVILTDGATEALSATFMAMLNPGDEVIIPTPAFGLYESIVVANHAKAVFLDTEPAQFQIDEDALRACVTPATKAIVICTPNNPTGCILNAASLDAVARVGEPNFIRMAVSKTKFDFDSLSVEGFTYKLIANPRTIGVKYDLSGLSGWKDVASSVDIFVSRPFVINDLDSTIKTVTVLDKNNMMVDLPFKSESELLEEIGEISNFYLVKSIPIGDISNGFENIFAEGKAFKNLEQQEVATDDDFTRSRITGNLYTYNGKLHVGNIREKLAKPYPLGMFAVSDINEFTVNTEVHVKTESGMKIVHGASTAYGAMVSPYLSYPDSRAVKMIIYNDKYYDEIPLKPHPFLNIAYSLKGLYPHSITDKYGTYTPLPEDSVSVAPNKLKVSNVSNPFYFPAKQTYTVSSRNIVAMATATTALSTGQFGQFPLYVFTGEGVFALSVGTGDIAYANSFSVTRDVCNNPDSIVSTDDAIVFSTDSGLKVLSGSTVRDISSDMEGYLPTAVDSSPIIKKIAGVGGFSDKLSSTEFIYYLEEAKVGYNYEDKEVIVANRNYPYSYVFNMQSGSWYKISASINRFLNSYPECLAVFNDHGVYNMHNGHRTVNKILLLTRPIKFGTLTHKRIVQSAIRGVIRPSESLVYFRGETVKFRDQEILAFSKCGFYG